MDGDKGILILVLAGAAAAVLYAALRRGALKEREAGHDRDAFRRRISGPIRQSGPEEMRDPPSTWESADEESDESFPASDPPSRY